jgi:hypothetical protein
MNKQLPPFFIITGSCVRSQTFTPKYTSTETWVRYSDFVDYYPVALDECAEDKDALVSENARLKAEVERLTKAIDLTIIDLDERHERQDLRAWEFAELLRKAKGVQS